MDERVCWLCGVPLPEPAGAVNPGSTPRAIPYCGPCDEIRQRLVAAREGANLSADLRGVLAVGAELDEVIGMRRAVLSLDMWDHVTGMRVFALVTSEAAKALEVWDAVDDRGSRYVGFRTGGSGSDNWGQGYVDLFPAVDPAASSLTVRVALGAARSETKIDLEPKRSWRVPTVTIAPDPAADATRCARCGKRLNQPAAARFCPACRALKIKTLEARDADGPTWPRQLLPLAAVVGEIDGGPLIILGMECWPGWSTIRYHHAVD